MSLASAFDARGVVAERELAGGHRNRVFLVRSGGQRLVAKTTLHSEAALQWLLPVLKVAETCGLGPPCLIADGSGALGRGGLTLEPFIDGRAALPWEVHGLQPRLRAFHARLRPRPQRPGCKARALERLPAALSGKVRTAGRVALQPLAHGPFGVVHGDVTPANCLVDGAGPHLIDWDECRRDSLAFDLPLSHASSPVRQARRLAEIGAGWQVEPAYARRLLKRAVSRASNKPD